MTNTTNVTDFRMMHGTIVYLYPARAECGPFVVHLAYYSGMNNEDDEEVIH